jgi:RHS repeat-associated protein
VYDGVYRLKSESYTGGLTINYTYDGVGNRLTEARSGSPTSYAYDSDNRLTSRGTATYVYDDNGNTVSQTVPGQGTTTYAYDFENRLRRVTLPNATTVDYAYSVRGHRSSTTMGGVATYLMYDFYDFRKVEDRIAEYTVSGSLLARYVHGPGIDEPLALVRGTTYYYSANAIGTITTLTTASQAVAASYEYEAFGALRAPASVPSNPYRFTAREWDSASQSYYFRARWYDPSLGRFQVADPWKFVDGPNHYLYTADNPVNRVDPKGLSFGDCRIPCMNGGGGSGGGGGGGGGGGKRRDDGDKPCDQIAIICQQCDDWTCFGVTRYIYEFGNTCIPEQCKVIVWRCTYWGAICVPVGGWIPSQQVCREAFYGNPPECRQCPPLC